MRVIDDDANCKAIAAHQKREGFAMLRRFTGILCLLAITCSGLAGCASGFGMNRSKFARGEQWEPDVEEETTVKNWRSTPSAMRSSSDRKSTEDVLDKYIWSDTSRDINRSLGGSL